MRGTLQMLFLVGALLGSARVAAAAEARPNLLLVTVDTLRPDALGWVEGGEDTPALDRLAAGGMRFPSAVAPAPLTLPSHASLLSSRTPPGHGVHDNGQVLGKGVPLLAEVLAEAGWSTAAFVSGYPLSAPFGLARGFGHFDDRLTAGEGAWLERPAAATTEAALEWLAGAAEPWFLWVHYYDPHYPYLAADGSAADGPEAYRAEVRRVDRAFERLWQRIDPEARSRLLTVFTADHGESLGEHGEGTHGYYVYDATILVPVVFHRPGAIEPRAGEAAVRLVDLGPTVLDLLGLEGLEGGEGVSLAPLLRGEPQQVPPAYVESEQPWRSYGWAPLRGVRDARWKWIRAPRPELYDLEADPGEAVNLYPERRVEAHRLERLLRQRLAQGDAMAAADPDPETRRKLEALGYLSGPAPPEAPGSLPDPKEMAPLRDLLTEGAELLSAGRFREALAPLEKVLGEDPENLFALSRSGLAHLRLGQAGEAVERLRRALGRNAEAQETRSLLGEAYLAAGDLTAAIETFREAVRRQPERADLWSNLGSALGRAGRLPEALDALERALSLEPENPERHIRLAFAQHAAGNPETAVTHLLRAADLSGAAFPHSASLGLLLTRLDRPDEALPWLTRATPTEPDFPRARIALARLLLQAGDPGAAASALREALAAASQLRPAVEADPVLAPLLD